ncbi:type I restriction endonuclease subunit R [Clostridium sporogenes]|uniref:type I restriction endonuclease subunit R n=1 Tax=Clostridium sporogenes TaxID=1509 RepID=UPI0013CF83C5|nr:HsdR family type I site-specific deoxyribonuclease [Clostridium sporogenes]NFH41454.1 type I restriction endonuclease subunit R [Clostridium sporogenes]
MAELEASIEKKLIDQLEFGNSQWTYRKDLKTESALWDNFRYILEQHNKAKLNDIPLSDSEFEQVKNQLQFSSFYEAGKWLIGENGVAQVHVQRGTETLHLMVLNQEHVAGGTSVYEVINQYNALKEDDDNIKERDRRFDVTLLINGLPMIHIELKNREHSYMDGFWQIKKYISEGKFRGIFSATQMFVISNASDTKYFAAADAPDLNPKFLSGWLDEKNKPVANYLDFAKTVLRIPEAHEMVSKYTVLDKEAKSLILLRPYQIHAIEAIREASKRGQSGFVWHTTGSGKTMTSYKATRNLLMDIPAIEKTIFLIDRKDLDEQTALAFQSYANSDVIDVDETDNVTDLSNKLVDGKRQMIVTTIQKLQILIKKRLAGKEDTSKYKKIKALRIAFVVDECHRAVTPATKREMENFFLNSYWYGFTGTPRFDVNPYPEMGDLPRTTKQLYGEILHSYTIKEAIHDRAVLGFQVEHIAAPGLDKNDSNENINIYKQEQHMLGVLDLIINKSSNKFGFQNGRGQTYEAILTTSSIPVAQKYYELLKQIKNDEKEVKISEEVKKVLPDFPKFAITYSVTEDEEGSTVNQDKMAESLDDYNKMFGTHYDKGQIQAYNTNLNKRLARKEQKYKSRDQQLDLVIVVERLLTGFDAPCLSTLFIDKQPSSPHDLIQAFSRTNRIFDKNKIFGHVVTFQSPNHFKKAIDDALKLYSSGGTNEAVVQDWDEVEKQFIQDLASLRYVAPSSNDVPSMSLKEKKKFAKKFQAFDRLFAQLRAFTKYEESDLEKYGITQLEYEEYAAHYNNVMEELKNDGGDTDKPGDGDEDTVLDTEYELMSYIHTRIDYEYIVNLIQDIVNYSDDKDEETEEERSKKIEEAKEFIAELSKENEKMGALMMHLITNVENNREAYKNKHISSVLEDMRHKAIETVVVSFANKWFVDVEAVMYAAENYKNGEIPNISIIKEKANYSDYKSHTENASLKFKYHSELTAELRKVIEEEIIPLRRER